MYIYKITNKINEKIYIGQTVRSIKERWWNHCSSLSNCKALSSAINKYGKENFTIEEIDTAENLEELNKKEEFYIYKFNSTNNKIGYNLKTGGDNCIFSQEARLKMGVKSKKNWDNKKRREELSNRNKNNWKNPEYRQKMYDKKSKPFKLYKILKFSGNSRVDKKIEKKEYLNTYVNQRECAKLIDISPQSLNKCLNKDSKYCGDYYAEYLEVKNE